MKIKRRSYPLEVKMQGDDDSGEFTGYGSVYDVIDSYREVVAPGAFAESLSAWKAKGKLPPILWQHRAGEPLGPYLAMREDTRGLFVHGRLLVDDVPRAREARALLKAKAISGLSIGFQVPEGGEDYDSRSGIVTLTKIDLWEVSIATFAANESASVDAVKSLFDGETLPTIRDFEEHLREAGFTRMQAKAIASHGLTKLLREAEATKATALSDVDVRSIVADIFN